MKYSDKEARKRMSRIFLSLSIVLTVLFFTAGSVYMWQAHSYSVSEKSLQDKVDKLKNSNFEKEKRFDSQSTQIVSDASGIDFNRVSKDAGIAKELFSPIFTWDSPVEYLQHRAEFLKKVEIDPRSSFAVNFLPGEDSVMKPDVNGNMVYTHPDANSRLSKFNTYVTSIDNSIYHYFTVVEITSERTNKYGTGSATAYAAIGYSVDITGKVSNVEGWVAPNTIRRSEI